MDVAPTLLYFLGLPVARDMDGFARTDLFTQAFNEQTEFTSGEDATALGEENAGDGDVAAESVEVGSVEVDGDSATAEVAFSGGSLGGQEIAVSLVKEEDQWKLNSLDEIDAASDDEIQEAYLSGDEDQLVGLFGNCFQ